MVQKGYSNYLYCVFFYSAAANAAAAYQTGQTGYPVGHTPTGTYTTQRAAGSTYDTGYQTAAAAATHSTAAGTYPSAAASATYDYGYGRTTQTAAAAAAAAYDSSKTYYAQPSSATAYTGADTHYHSKIMIMADIQYCINTSGFDYIKLAI